MRTTIKQVAAKAGVSPMTVSNALHGAGVNVRVSAETAERIRLVASELNYQPNTLARSLRNRKTGMVGVVCRTFDRLSEQNPYYPQLLNGIMSSLFPENYTLALCPSLVTGSLPPTISDGRFDGVLWARPDFGDESLDILRRSRIPIVMMHAPPGSADGIATFTADNDDAMRQVVSHLTSLGHSQITFVVDEFNQFTAEGKSRVKAFIDAVESASLKANVWVWDERMGTLETFLARNRSVTALACFSDTIAGQILHLCRELGVAIPRDLSVVGFDSSSFCDRTFPPLTSVHQSVERMAAEATAHLLFLIKQGDAGRQPGSATSSIYGCSLDIRQSTARPASSTVKILHE